MTPAQTILKMIESVDPKDTATLDAIDARVYALVHGYRLGLQKSPYLNGEDILVSQYQDGTTKAGCRAIKYTRSRDALKSIRPEGWQYTCQQDFGSNEWLVTLQSWGPNSTPKKRINGNTGMHVWRKTEELAELHAIIAAIEHERGSE